MRAEQEPLMGFDVGLSGAVPEPTEWQDYPMDRAILEFVSVFCAMVFKKGGRIVHGSHPSFTPAILRQARLHAGQRARKSVTLVASDLWAGDWDRGQWSHYLSYADVVITRQVGRGGPENVETRNESLRLMRRVLMQQMNTLVAVGGKLHWQDQKVPGVGEELAFASHRGMPCFLVGALGGFAEALGGSDAVEGILNNGLDHEQNLSLMRTRNVASLVGTIVEQLAQNPQLARRRLTNLHFDLDERVSPQLVGAGAE